MNNERTPVSKQEINTIWRFYWFDSPEAVAVNASVTNILAAYEQFLANVNSSSCSLYVVVRPSVVCL